MTLTPAGEAHRIAEYLLGSGYAITPAPDARRPSRAA